MAQIRTFTAPKAFIMIEGEPAGLIRSISFTENIGRAAVRGLGNLQKQEEPAVSIDCTFTVDQFFIDFEQPVVAKMINRTGSKASFLNTLTFGELSFSIYIYSKQISGLSADGRVVEEIDPTGKTIAALRDCYLTSQSFNLAEGGISGLNISGSYLTPVVLNP
jgi:hypothetical protein